MDIQEYTKEVSQKEINQVKDKFLKWLKSVKAEDIDVYDGEKEPDDGWDYYSHVSAFVNGHLYSVYFTMWNGTVKIDYSDEENRYSNMSIEEFQALLW